MVESNLRRYTLNVLSLFDGMSCGQLALQRANIHYSNYFASEIDKYAIKITQKNFPETIQLGDVNNWINWNLPKIDLLIGGSPCQGFSIAGIGLNFDDPRSRLFFRFVDCLKQFNPKWFLLENVKMKKEWQDIISSHLRIEPIEINSALVSAQNRKRLYWTNIPNITQPKDERILLKDIIESGKVDREKSYCIDANYFKGGSLKMYAEKKRRQIVNLPSNSIHQSEKRLMVQIGSIFENNAQAGRIYSLDGKSVTINSNGGGMGGKTGLYLINEKCFRKLTPLECERLQTVPDKYTEGVSDSQRYKMLGNGWTVDVIVHILKGINDANNTTGN